MDKDLNGGSNGLLRGEKGETWEGGNRYVCFRHLIYIYMHLSVYDVYRVPGIFYWPGKIPAANVSY